MTCQLDWQRARARLVAEGSCDQPTGMAIGAVALVLLYRRTTTAGDAILNVRTGLSEDRPCKGGVQI